MEFVCDSVDKPLELWGTESILEYFKAMRDMPYDGFATKYGFYPLWWQVVVDDTVVVCRDGLGQTHLDAVVTLLESLSDEWQLWNHAHSVIADEFERELCVVINTKVSPESVKTRVDVSEPMNIVSSSALEFAMSSFDEELQQDIKCLKALDLSRMNSDLTPTTEYILLLRSYVIDAMNCGRTVVCADDSSDGPIDGWVRCADQIGGGCVWPYRKLDGYIALSTDSINDDGIRDDVQWYFGLEMSDSTELGKVQWSIDLMFYDYLDTYLVTKGFASGIIDEPSWWEERMAWDDDEDEE